MAHTDDGPGDPPARRKCLLILCVRHATRLTSAAVAL
jgi:hypothetical protein